MRIIHVPLEKIQFDWREPRPSLKASVLRVGVSFPIRVKQIDEDHFVCIDGHQRLTILAMLAKEIPEHRFLERFPVVVVNTDLVRSNDCSRARNMH